MSLVRFILIGILFAFSATADAQQPGNVHRIGLLSGTSLDARQLPKDSAKGCGSRLH
jgi:hypothetical protein